MNKRMLLLSVIALVAVGAALYWYLVIAPQPTVKLQVSDLGTLMKITDKQGNDISQEPLVDGYTVVYEEETKPDVWEPRTFNAVGNKSSEKIVSSERPKSKQLDTFASVVVTTTHLRIISSFFVKRVSGKDQLHSSRAIEPLDGKKIRGTSVLVYSSARPFEYMLNPAGKKIETMWIQAAILNKTCWPCEDPPCAELTAGQLGEERIACVVCPSDFQPTLIPAQRSELFRSSGSEALRGEGEVDLTAIVSTPRFAGSCRLPGVGVFPYTLPTTEGGIEMGRPGESNSNFLLACTTCSGDLPIHPETGRGRAFDMHRLTPDESVNFGAWLESLPDGQKCLYPIRFNVFDRRTGEGAFAVWPFVVLERREIAR